MDNQKNFGRYLLYIGAGLSILSLIGLISVQSARRSSAFSGIISVTDCQISFLKGGAGCTDPANPLDGQEALWQAGLVLGTISLGVAAWMNWAAKNRPAPSPLNGAKGKGTSKAQGSSDVKQKLVALQELREEKLISEAEFKSRRDRLLGDL